MQSMTWKYGIINAVLSMINGSRRDGRSLSCSFTVGKGGVKIDIWLVLQHTPQMQTVESCLSGYIIMCFPSRKDLILCETPRLVSVCFLGAVFSIFFPSKIFLFDLESQLKLDRIRRIQIPQQWRRQGSWASLAGPCHWLYLPLRRLASCYLAMTV